MTSIMTSTNDTLASELVTTPTTTSNGIRTPLDPLIRYIANRVGGNKSKEVERFLRFAIVGASGALIDMGLVYKLQADVLPPTSQFNVILVSAIAFCAAVLSNFIWTRLWVYPDSRSRSFRRQLALFTFISTVGGVSRTAWIAVSHTFIGNLLLEPALPFIRIFRPYYEPGPQAAEKLGTMVALVIAMVVVMLWNFFANRYWTYNDID